MGDWIPCREYDGCFVRFSQTITRDGVVHRRANGRPYVFHSISH